MPVRELKHYVTPEEAAVVRHVAQVFPSTVTDGDVAAAVRIFQPIERGSMKTSGRGRCRECGLLLQEGEPIIRFGFDPYASPGRWGLLNAAYLHVRCPEREENP